MSSRSMPWFRMYTDFLNDPKMIALAFEDQRHFIGVLALKCDGALDQDCCPDLLDRIVAQRLWIDHAAIREVKKRLIAAGLIDCNWQPVAWNKRQMRSDSDPTGAERQRRYRERQKQQKSQEKVSNASRNAAVTLPDTDTDTDTEEDKDKEKQSKKTAPRTASISVSDLTKLDVDKQVAIEFLALRKKKRATLTPLALEGIRREAGRAEMTLDEALRKCIERGWQGFEAAWVANDRSTAGRTPRAEDFKEKQYVGTDESAIGWL